MGGANPDNLGPLFAALRGAVEGQLELDELQTLAVEHARHASAGDWEGVAEELIALVERGRSRPDCVQRLEHSATCFLLAGGVLLGEGRDAAAVSLARAAVALFQTEIGRAYGGCNLAAFLRSAGRWPEAIEAAAAALPTLSAAARGELKGPLLRGPAGLRPLYPLSDIRRHAILCGEILSDAARRSILHGHLLLDEGKASEAAQELELAERAFDLVGSVDEWIQSRMLRAEACFGLGLDREVTTLIEELVEQKALEIDRYEARHAEQVHRALFIYAEATARISDGISEDSPTPRPSEAVAIRMLQYAERRLAVGDLDNARLLVLSAASALNSPTDRARGLRVLAEVSHQRGLNTDAIAFADRALAALAKADEGAIGVGVVRASCLLTRAESSLALEDFTAAEEACVAAEPDLHTNSGRARCSLIRGYVCRARGAYREARARAETAVRLSHTSEPGICVPAMLLAAEAMTMLGDFASAEELLVRVECWFPELLRQFVGLGPFWAVQWAALCSDMGWIYALTGRDDEALRSLKRAGQTFSALGRGKDEVVAAMRLGDAYRIGVDRPDRPRLERAAEAYRGAVAAAEQHGQRELLAQGRCRLAAVLIGQASAPRGPSHHAGGYVPELLERAAAAAAGVDPSLLSPSDRWMHDLVRLAIALAGGDPWPSARRLLLEARRSFDTFLRVAGMDATSLRALAGWKRGMSPAVSAALGHSEPELAWSIVQQLKGHVVAQIIEEWSQDGGPPGTRERIELVRAELGERLRRAAGEAAAKASPPNDAAEASPSAAPLDELSDEYMRCWREAYIGDPPGGERGDDSRDRNLPDPHGAASLPDGWAIVDFWMNGPGDSWAFIRDGRRLVAERVTYPPSDPRWPTAHKEALEWHEGNELTSPAPHDLIGDCLFRPLLPLIGGLEGLYVVPHAFLHWFPIHAARLDGVPLCDRFQVAYLPSASLLDRIPALALGDRALSLANPDRGSRMTLPFAEWEAGLLSRHDAGRWDLHAGPEASAARLEGWDRYSVIHLSAHAVGEVRYGWRSHVLLADDVLMAHDILSRRPPLRPGSLVLLSGCRTACRDRDDPDEGMGLPAAFLARGAGLVLCSMWPVDDLCAALALSRFMERLSAGDRPAIALRSVQKRVRTATRSELAEIAASLAERWPAADHPHEAARLAELLDARFLSGRGSQLPYSRPFHWASFHLVGRIHD